MEDSRIAPWPLSLKYHTEDYFKSMIKRVDDVEKGIDLDGYSSSTYWLYDEVRDTLIGASNVRDEIIGESGLLWWHIGYGIRPSERCNAFIKLTLAKAQKKGFNSVYAGVFGR